jgi:3-oxoacyl-(acyl-carrier-protein) synthase
MSRVSQLALHSISQLNGFPPDTVLVVGTSKGAVESWLDPDPLAGGLLPTGIASIADDVARQLGLSGLRLTVSAACASGLHALIRATLMIRSGEAASVLVVAAESSLHPLFVGSFARLGVLSRCGACRPFDKARDGFLMSEAAAAVWLRGIPHDSERLKAAGEPQCRGRAPCITVERFAMGGDATHLTGGDPDGRLLRRLIAQMIGDEPVDLVHAHATGTGAHDPVELSAIDDCCREQRRPPALYSHKAALGHSLGAAGLVSVVLNWVAHQRSVVPPNAHTRDALAARHLSIEQGAQSRRIRRSIAIASGFGGPTAAVALKTHRCD